MVADHPTTIKLDERYRLHSVKEPALAFGDDIVIHAIHGVTVPSQTIAKLHDGTLTGREIIMQDNAEVRRVLIEQIGFKRFLSSVSANVINRDPDPQWGTLYHVNGVSAGFVKVRNCSPEPDGTFKDYVLACPQQIRTAKEAVLWTQYLTLAEHENLEQRYGHWRS